MDARIPDHSAWAARGHWNKAYAEAQAEIARLQAEVGRWKNAFDDCRYQRDKLLLDLQDARETAKETP